MVNRNLGIRRSYLNEATRVAKELLARKLQTIVFANSRLHTEVLLTYLQQANPPQPGEARADSRLSRRLFAGRAARNRARPARRAHSRRGGDERAGIGNRHRLARRLRDGGYAGSIASTWQRAGRAGRRSGSSCAVLVASSAPLDQFIVQHPDYFFGRSPEHAFVQPDNLEILVNHLKCAAFELPLSPEEKFGDVDLPELCERLAEAGFLHRSGGNWHWAQEAYPADTVSLRSVTSDNFVIIDTSGHAARYRRRSAGSDRRSGFFFGADHGASEGDLPAPGAAISRGAPGFRAAQSLREAGERGLFHRRDPLHAGARARNADEERIAGPAARAHGDVLVRSQVVGFKKIKFFTNENVGAGKLELPENEMHTTAFWITLERSLLAELPFAISERQSGMFGLLHALESIATLLLMCDRRDLGTAIGERPPSPGIETKWTEYTVATDEPGEAKEFFEPNLYLYDAYPGGIGFSEPLYRVHDLLLRRTRELIAACPCENGCPSCVGPRGEKSERAKEVALAILDRLCV